jgi:hypothetical protein
VTDGVRRIRGEFGTTVPIIHTDIILKDYSETTKARIQYEYDTEGNKKSEKYYGQGTAVKKYLDSTR